MTDCPCGSQLSSSACCAPILSGERPAATPLELMRSRYCAYVHGKPEYLLRTTLPEQQTELNLDELRDWISQSRWKALCILDAGAATTGGEEGWVEFEALYVLAGKHYRHRERSHFECRAGTWYYDMLPAVDKWAGSDVQRPVGRNDACPCGSGKKLKKCCALP